MNYTGNVLFNVFAGNPDSTPPLNPMTRSIAIIGKQEYALYLNELDAGVLVAAHHVEGRDGNKPIVNRNPIAQAICDEIEGLDGMSYAFTLELDNGYVLDDFVVSNVRINKNGTEYRLAQPLAIAKVRAKAIEKTPEPAPAPVKTGTGGNEF